MGVSGSRAGAVSVGRACTLCHTLSLCTSRPTSPVGLQGAGSDHTLTAWKVNRGEKMSLSRLTSRKGRGLAVPVSQGHRELAGSCNGRMVHCAAL